MSTAYARMSDGQLWNVMLQRMTGSTSTKIINEYRLHSSLQRGRVIKTYNYITMSISGSGAATNQIGLDSNAFANKNWMSTGSRGTDILSSSNLFVGESVSGSLSEIRAWDSALSISKFRQHTLNKSSTVGNTLFSHCHELVYHFKLNENYSSASVSSSTQILPLVDASPTHGYKNHSLMRTGSYYTGSYVYGYDFIDSVKTSLYDNSGQRNDNSILINPNKPMVGDLSMNQESVLSVTDTKTGKPKVNTSTKLEMYRSPQNFVDSFILDKITGFNLEKKYGNPISFYSQSYNELDDFRNEFFDCYTIKLDANNNDLNVPASIQVIVLVRLFTLNS